MVDSKTASASEILSAALKDNGRAMLAGQKTFGKAKVLLCCTRSTVSLLHTAYGRVMMAKMSTSLV